MNVLESAAARESILDRLKARASGQPAQPLPPPSDVSRYPVIPEKFDPIAHAPALAVEPQMPKPAPAPVKPPEPPPKPVPIAPPPAPAPLPPPPPPAPPTFTRPNPLPSFTDRPQKAPPAASPLHTYTGDFAHRIDERGANSFSVLAAEKDAKRVVVTVRARRVNGRTALAFIGGIILLSAGGTGVYYAYVANSAKQPVMVTPGVPSLIFVDDRAAVHGTGTMLRQAILDAAAKPLAAGKARLTYLAIATTTATGGTQDVPQPGGALVDALMLPAPDILLRHIGEDSTVGIMHAGDETAPFFILSVDSYDRTFAGMLQWEPTIARDLAEFYPAYPAAAPVFATSTASTSPAVSPTSVPYAAQFSDEIVANHDARALKDTNGRTVLLYGYQDPGTLIIARDEAAFTELLNRLSASNR